MTPQGARDAAAAIVQHFSGKLKPLPEEWKTEFIAALWSIMGGTIVPQSTGGFRFGHCVISFRDTEPNGEGVSIRITDDGAGGSGQHPGSGTRQLHYLVDDDPLRAADHVAASLRDSTGRT